MNRLTTRAILVGATALSALVAASSVPAQTRPRAQAAPTPAAPTQAVTGPVATYWMSTTTESGLPGMSAGGGGMGNIMAMMSGRGGGVNKTLHLELQSSRQTASPSAFHTAPPELGVRAPLPLRTSPPSGPGERAERQPNDTPDFGRVRLLVYSGCGAATKPGQPMVIDIAREGVTGLGRLNSALTFNAAIGPMPGANRTYGDWPHGDNRETIGPNASLVGTHTIRGDYSPDIDVTLTPQQDFMEALRLTGTAPGDPSGLGWNALPNARGYFASTMGSAGNGDVVIWSSSETPVFPYMMPTYLTDGDLTRLLRDRTLLPADTTQCRIPDAVQQAAPESMLKVQAFGGDVDFSYPPRPADRRQTWNIDYVVKVRYASSTTTVMGMDLSEMGGARSQGEEQPRGLPIPTNAGDAARSVLRGLGGLRRRN